jgi:hypothetical protein
MYEKLVKPISSLRVPMSVHAQIEAASEQLSMPKAVVMRLAIIAGLPLVVRQVRGPQEVPK